MVISGKHSFEHLSLSDSSRAFIHLFTHFSQKVHEILYLNQGVAISAEHESLYSSPSITVYSISPLTSLTGAVSYSYSVQVISLIEAIQSVIDKARAVSLLSPAQVTLNHPDVFFLIKNSPEAIFQTLNRSSDLYVEAVRRQVHHCFCGL